MKKVALITGILGQDGPFLAQELIENDYKVYGMIRRYSNPHFDNLEYLNIQDKVELVNGDMTDDISICNIVKSIRPEYIFNLAAQSFVQASFDQPKYTVETNGLGPLYFLEAIKRWVPHSRFYQASTSELYGGSQNNQIQDENTPFQPKSPYAAAKAYAFFITQNYRESYNIFASNGILFNHESELRGHEFITRKISMGVAKISLGLQKEITLGNLDAERDWGYAQDYTHGMRLILEHSKPDDFILATGKTYSVRDFLDAAFEIIGIKDWSTYVKQDPRFMRPSEVKRLLGSYDKAKRDLGWEPKVDFKNLVKKMVAADINRLKK